MRAFIIGILGLVFLAGPATSQQNPTWFSHYLKADEADEVSVCIAAVSYNNASFFVRLYGENMDFIFNRDDFTLPYGEVLGKVKLWIDGQIYELAAYSFEKSETDRLTTSQRMQLLILREEYSAIFNALKFGTDAYLEFPNGSNYQLSLRGSNKALSAAANCWTRNETGPIDNNPFEGDERRDDSENNPFADL